MHDVSTQTQVTNNGTISGGVLPKRPGRNCFRNCRIKCSNGTGNCGGGCTVTKNLAAISSVTATPGACNSGSNQPIRLTGAVTFSNAPSSGIQ